MTDVVSEEKRALIAARQWLEILIQEFGLDPAITKMEAVTVGSDGRRQTVHVTLAETLAQIDAITVTVVTKADNDV
jgi:hypothetical protein